MARPMKQRGRIALAGAGLLVSLSASAALGADAAATDAASPGSPDGATLRVYRDPATGRFVEPPQGAGAVSASPRARAVPAPLVITPSTSPAGGLTLDHAGRFESEFVATRTPGGEVKVDCLPASPTEGR